MQTSMPCTTSAPLPYSTAAAFLLVRQAFDEAEPVGARAACYAEQVRSRLLHAPSCPSRRPPPPLGPPCPKAAVREATLEESSEALRLHASNTVSGLRQLAARR